MEKSHYLRAFRELMVKMKQVKGFYYLKMKHANKLPIEVALIDFQTGNVPSDPCIFASCKNPECIYDLKTVWDLLEKENKTICPCCRNTIDFDDVYLDSSLSLIIKTIEPFKDRTDYFVVVFFSNQDWASKIDSTLKGRVDTSSGILLQWTSLTIENSLKYRSGTRANKEIVLEDKKTSEKENVSESDSSDLYQEQEALDEIFYLQRRQADVAATRKKAVFSRGSNKLKIETDLYAYNIKSRDFDCYLKSEDLKLFLQKEDQCAVDTKENILLFDGFRILCSRSTYENDDLIFAMNVTIQNVYQIFNVIAGSIVFYIIGITKKWELWIHRFFSPLEKGCKQHEFQMKKVEKVFLKEVHEMEAFVIEDSEIALLFYDKERKINGSLVVNFEKKKQLFAFGPKIDGKVKETKHEKGRNQILISNGEKAWNWNINANKLEEEVLKIEL